MVRIIEHDPEPASTSPRGAEAHKLEGNRAFGDGRFEDAERHYTAALEASAPAADEGASDEPDETEAASARRDAREDDRARTSAGTTDGAPHVPSSDVISNEASRTASSETSRDVVVDRARATYFANRAACRLKLARPNEAAEDCTRALRCDESFVKARLRRAEARETADPKDLEGALADCEAAATDARADAGLRLRAETAAAPAAARGGPARGAEGGDARNAQGARGCAARELRAEHEELQGGEGRDGRLQRAVRAKPDGSRADGARAAAAIDDVGSVLVAYRIIRHARAFMPRASPRLCRI